jgi:hypothetical protein
MTFRKDWLEKYESLEGLQVTIADGRDVVAKGKGNIRIESLVDGKWTPGMIYGALYVPEFGRNLLSVKEMTRHGLTVSFSKTGALIKKKGTVKAVATLEKGLFIMEMRAGKSTANTRDNIGITTWHERMGHINYKYLNEMIKNKTATGLTLKEENKTERNFCEDCIFGSRFKRSQ